jgi:cyanophycinase
MSRISALLAVAGLFAAGSLASAQSVRQSGVQTKVGPSNGTVIVVGGGAMGPEIYKTFIDAAGGPDALIVDVPTAGGDSVYGQDAPGTRGWKSAGAKNVVVVHTIDRKIADSDSFPKILAKAGGVWFEGGRQWHLVDSYAGTKTEQAFHDVLARGGVVGGSSAGASILASFLVRGARQGNTVIVAPDYQKGFGFLRGVGIDQHVVARERLRDLADSLMPRHPELLGMSEDEGTAWVVRGDTATIIGRNKAFVYGGKDATDPGKPFLTLHPGDRYNLATRHVMHRAIADSRLTEPFVDGLFSKYSNPALGGAAVLVAQNGEVLVDKSYGIPDQARYMPTTTVPQFALGGMSRAFEAVAAQALVHDGALKSTDTLADGVTVGQFLAGERTVANGDSLLAALVAARAEAEPSRGRRGARGGRAASAPNPAAAYNAFLARGVYAAGGEHKTTASANGEVHSDVDELYRFELGLESLAMLARDSAYAGAFDPRLGWQVDQFDGMERLSAFAAPNGRRGAFVRIPDKDLTVIVLTNDDAADAKTIADAIVGKTLRR